MPSYRFMDLIPYNKINVLSKTNIKAWRDTDAIPKPYDHLVWDIKANGLIGIEVEVEGIDMPNMPLLTWSVLHDGSLRNNGYEYRTQAFPANFSPEVLTELYAGLERFNVNYDFSDRCSTHVHLDFRMNLLEDLPKFFLVYLPFERLLFEMVCPDRYKNAFCMPINDVLAGNEEMYKAVQQMRQGEAITLMEIENITDAFKGKYAALNPRNIWARKAIDGAHTGSGTLEFRQLHGTKDTQLLLTWIKLLCLMKEYVSETPFKEIEQEILTLNSSSQYQLFASKVFGQYSHIVLPNHRLFEFMPLVSEGISAAKELLVSKYLDTDPVEFLSSNLARTLQKRMYLGKKKNIEKAKPFPPLEDLQPEPARAVFANQILEGAAAIARPRNPVRRRIV